MICPDDGEEDTVQTIIGTKIGMTQIFGEDGRMIPVTVIQAGPVQVIRAKTKASDGYDAIQLGYGEQIDGDPYSFANINRKMQGMDIGSCNPLYFSEGIDISRPVVEMLNLNFQRSSGVTPVSGTTTPNQK